MKSQKDRIPDWVKNRVGYICFVDSFANSGSEKKSKYDNKVYGREIVQLELHEKDNTLFHSSGFYGGDIKGISNAIGYLKNLGIDLLYLSPIFSAVSNHKYDTIDYEKIDKHFGTYKDFTMLIDQLHQNDIKIILDGVFNHTSSQHEWYKNALEGQEEYINYYKTNNEGYILFWNGIDTLPVLDHNNPEIQNYFYKSENSIVRKWLSDGIDGWRLDVAERLGKNTLKNIRASMKTKFPESLLIGEVVESYGKEWLGNGLLDGVMNYVFRGVTANYLTDWFDGNRYLEELVKMYNEYPREKLFASWNILSTHDTNRILFDVKNDESLFKIAAVMQFTYPGIPFIYFGDELGTTFGEKEVNNRVGMDWDCVKSYEKFMKQESMPWKKYDQYNKFHQFYKHLIWLRKNYSVLSEGDFIPIFSNKSVVAFMRILKDGAGFIIINKGENQSVTFEIPDFIIKKNLDLKCVYGGNTSFYLTNRTINFYIGGRNA